ncbi:hypothetical protein RF11_15544 [Thelohanellus kitauei]|uniref:Proteasome assembly chaperone 4 n=1 Tax=Thelohanellus kitauei TaxID=669202 RepID=A0A0C2JW32_THEKT|nr:hypothetical protein RF11_15544 [Thelohanellus kitauei]
MTANEYIRSVSTGSYMVETGNWKVYINALVKTNSIFLWIGSEECVDRLNLYAPSRYSCGGSRMKLFENSESVLSASIARRISSYFKDWLVLTSINIHPSLDSTIDNQDYLIFVSKISKYVIEKVNELILQIRI